MLLKPGLPPYCPTTLTTRPPHTLPPYHPHRHCPIVLPPYHPRWCRWYFSSSVTPRPRPVSSRERDEAHAWRAACFGRTLSLSHTHTHARTHYLHTCSVSGDRRRRQRLCCTHHPPPTPRTTHTAHPHQRCRSERNRAALLAPRRYQRTARRTAATACGVWTRTARVRLCSFC